MSPQISQVVQGFPLLTPHRFPPLIRTSQTSTTVEQNDGCEEALKLLWWRRFFRSGASFGLELCINISVCSSVCSRKQQVFWIGDYGSMRPYGPVGFPGPFSWSPGFVSCKAESCFFDS
ncbi:hypothetical protein VTJ04DRAFT_5867 [Mycothermus thermophilus]|uniref:uncharacterized protein n=1 Tax=Humicola insolens TaxID=85995 RepID=UPI003743AA4E